jgi:predicted O-methyltransferase YrrM
MIHHQAADLPGGDYVSPGLAIVMPDAAFPNMIIGDKSVTDWPYFRRWVNHNWYVDKRSPQVGFANRDEAAILYNSARLFAGQPCLEIGCWRGWSAVHLALGGVVLDVIDPGFTNPEFTKSVTDSCDAAGVRSRVTLYAGASPGAIHALREKTGQTWPLFFIDGNHEGDGPRQDAEAALRYAAPTAMVLFHDLASPYVAAGLDAMRNAGWQTMVYQTMQIMGVAWRGNVTPVAHTPDPGIFWTLPRHLSGYTVSNWARPTAGADAAETALLRAQSAEDECFAARLERDAALRRAQALQAVLATAQAERDAALATAKTMEAALALLTSKA